MGLLTHTEVTENWLKCQVFILVVIFQGLSKKKLTEVTLYIKLFTNHIYINYHKHLLQD